MPFIEYEAEDAEVEGTVIGPDRAYGTLAAEAVGRQAVRLDGQGQYVEFELTEPANALNLRYSIPDSADGQGLDATLGVYVDGERIDELDLTSRYSWYYGQYPWTNDPADGGRRHMYDDSRVLLGTTLPAGTKVRLEVGEQDDAPWYVVDVADFELVADPAAPPAGASSVVDFGADPTGATDSSEAIQAAIDAAAGTGTTVWLPPGTFTVTRKLIVDEVTLRGAGPWHSVLSGAGVGVFGRDAADASNDVHLADFAIFGDVRERDDSDPVYAIGGAMNNSTVDNLWIQHTKVGIWMTGPMDNFTVTRNRILDQTADGMNFVIGVTNTTVSDNYVRNTGDDGLAMWSLSQADANNTYTRNTVKVPILANGIAIYGGSDITVSDNLVTDTLTQGAGIQIANRFGAVPLAGTTTVSGNHLIRTGSLDLFRPSAAPTSVADTRSGNGALWFWAGDGAMTGTIDVRDNLIEDSSYSAVHFLGEPITGVSMVDNVIKRAGTYAVQLEASGSASFEKTRVSRVGTAGVYDCDSGFDIIDNGGNAGLRDVTCEQPDPGPLDVTGLGTTLDFGRVEVGQMSESQTVTITNPGPGPARLESVTNTGSFSLDQDCPTTLPGGASCTATLAFTPTEGGEPVGALTVSDGTPAGRYQVYLRGEVLRTSDPGESPNGNLAAGRPVTATSEIAGCCAAANAVDGDVETYWESANNAFPQSLTVDLGDVSDLARVVLKVNPAWGARNQTVEVRTSTDGATFTTAAPATEYTFDPANGNAVTLALPEASSAQFVQIEVTGNTGWPAAQIAELEVYPLVGDLAAGRPVTASSEIAGCCAAANAVDADVETYWESANNAFPQSLTVDLGRPSDLIHLVLKVNPAWGARNQTVEVRTSTDGATYATAVPATEYTFDPATNGNAVTISLPEASSAQFVQIEVTGNTGWPAAQIAELEVHGVLAEVPVEPAPGLTLVYLYQKVDPARRASWGNSGTQQLLAVSPGHTWGATLSLDDLPAEVCGDGWAVQTDHVVGLHQSDVPATIDRGTGTGVLGWGTMVRAARHHSLQFHLDEPIPACEVEPVA